MVEPIYTWTGRYFGYRNGDDLWTYDGRNVGRFEGGDIYGPDGKYLGEVRNGRYLICDTQKVTPLKARFTPKQKLPETVRHADQMGFAFPKGFTDFPRL